MHMMKSSPGQENSRRGGKEGRGRDPRDYNDITKRILTNGGSWGEKTGIYLHLKGEREEEGRKKKQNEPITSLKGGRGDHETGKQ